MLVNKRQQIDDFFQEATAMTDLFKNISGATHQQKLILIFMLSVFLVRTVENCLKIVFSFDPDSGRWKNNFEFIFEMAEQRGCKNTIKERIPRREITNFQSLVNIRNRFVHQNNTTDATFNDLELFFSSAENIVNTIADVILVEKS